MKILITAGPTREKLDPVRYLSNESTGVMGYALARAANRAGHRVTVVSGPVALKAPAGVRRISILSAADLAKACRREFRRHDALVMAAAVCDFAPRSPQREKIARRGVLRFALRKTPDIVAGLARRKGKRPVIGFCLESRDWIRKARSKRVRKGLDGIVANRIRGRQQPFGDRKVTVALIGPKGPVRYLVRKTKPQIAGAILGWLESIAESKSK